ncbi:unnamed protein product, partial [Candidula unifasciata]
QSLDSAVMEEWALHCWHQSPESEEPPTFWLSRDYQIQAEIMKNGFSGYGSLFTKEGFLELTARLPYVKVGPVRFSHITYLMMAVAWLTVAHAVMSFYSCSNGQYEYYCPEGDVDCLVQWLVEGD